MINPLKLNLIRYKGYEENEVLEHYQEGSLVGYKPMISFYFKNEYVVTGDVFFNKEQDLIVIATLKGNKKEEQAISGYGFTVIKSSNVYDLNLSEIEYYFHEEGMFQKSIYIGNMYVDKNIQEKLNELASQYNIREEVLKNIYVDYTNYLKEKYNANTGVRITYEYNHPACKMVKSSSRLQGLTSIAKELVKTQAWTPLLFKQFSYTDERAVPTVFRKELTSYGSDFMVSYMNSLHILESFTLSRTLNHINSLPNSYNKEYLCNLAKYYSRFFIVLDYKTGKVECKTVFKFIEADGEVDIKNDYIVYNPGSYEFNKYNPLAESDFDGKYEDMYDDYLLKII